MVFNPPQFPVLLDSQDWAEWLNLIKANPHQHGYLTKLGNQIRYLNNQERDQYRKTGFSVQALNSEKIFEVTKGFFQDPTTETVHKKQMLEGLRYIHKERQTKYQRLFFICRWFAKLRGVEARLQTEKQEIKHLKRTLQDELKQPIDNQKKKPAISSLEQAKENFDLLSQKFKELKAQQGTLPKKELDNWYETLFLWEKKVEDFKQTLQQAKDPHYWQEMKPSIRELEKQLEGWETTLPRLRQIVKVKGPEAIKSTLQETLYFLCADKNVTAAELTKEQKLFSVSTIESYARYGKRILKAERTELSLSLVTAIERAWEEVMRSHPNEEGKTRILEGHRVVFIPYSKKIYLKEGFTSKGTYKAAFLITPFHTLKKVEERCSLTLLQPLHAVQEEVEESIRNQAQKEGSPIGSIEQEGTETDDDTEDEGVDTLKSYQEEAENCLRYGKLPFIWPTIETPKIDGHIAIVQETAGYQFQTVDGKKVTAVTLADMGIFAMEKQLTAANQVVYLKMIGDFLAGIESLHKEKLIHRDLKPANILCTKEGGACISDLGTLCANEVLQKDPNTNEEKWVPNPQKECLIGSPQYIAPEVACYTETDKWPLINISADVWAVGIMLWELLSGQPFYEHYAFQDGKRREGAGYNWFLNGVKLIVKVKELLNSFRKPFYEKKYVEPQEKTSLAHLIWQCTRLDSNQRPKIEDIIKHYQAWAQHTIAKLEAGTVKSVDECFNEIV